MRKSERPRVVAYHEAGHAVIARAFGLGVPYITILRVDDETLAAAPAKSATHLARDADVAAQLSAIEKDAIVCLAGPTAQLRHRPVETQAGWDTDLESVNSFIVRAVLLEAGTVIPESGLSVTLSEDEIDRFRLRFTKLRDQTKALVE
jgi:hypothetical protein